MIKIAIFTEGQSEQIFVRNLLQNVFDNSRLSFECFKLQSEDLDPVPYRYYSPDPQIHFLIINVQNDERVISAIGEREKGLFQRGFEKIIGLRDMYSEAYKKRSPSVISDNVCAEFINGYNETIRHMENGDRISFHFSIMEIEAWFLAMYNVFRQLHPKLTVGYIESRLNFDLSTIDPQKEFYRPTEKMEDIFALINRQYDKKKGDSEAIVSKMHPEDFANATENGRCTCFGAFYRELIAYAV